jgi:hypothetical protein
MPIGSSLAWAGVIAFATLVVTAPFSSKGGVGD